MPTTPRNPPASSGPSMTSTTMTSPSVRRSLTSAEDEPITLKKKACRPVCRRQSVMIERKDPLFAQLPSAQNSKETQTHSSESEQIRTLLERQREQILADCQAEIRKHEFQADYDRRSKQKLNETIESQKEEIHRASQGERLRQYQKLLHEQLLKQNWDLREAHEKSLNEMEELKRFQGSTFDTSARRKLVEDRDTILELTGKIQELQNEINCMNNSRDFQDAESVRRGQSHVTNQPALFSPFRDPCGMLSRSLGMPGCSDRPPSIWDTHGISGNVFANPAASSSAPYPQELNPWSSNFSETFTHHMVGRVKTKHQLKIRDASQDRQPEFFSLLVREILQRIMGQTNSDCRSQIFISTTSPFTSNVCLLEDKIQDRGMYLFTISYGSYAVDQGGGDG